MKEVVEKVGSENITEKTKHKKKVSRAKINTYCLLNKKKTYESVDKSNKEKTDI